MVPLLLLLVLLVLVLVLLLLLLLVPLVDCCSNVPAPTAAGSPVPLTAAVIPWLLLLMLILAPLTPLALLLPLRAVAVPLVGCVVCGTTMPPFALLLLFHGHW